MAHFLVFARDPAPHAMALRDALRAGHRGYVLENDSPIRLAGAMRDAQDNQCGSIYSFEAESEDEVRAWLQAEPFVDGGVYERIEIVRWTPALNRLPPADW